MTPAASWRERSIQREIGAAFVIASEAKQSRDFAEELDCFVAVAPRNDEMARQKIIIF
jgi:hypothetical protein